MGEGIPRLWGLERRVIWGRESQTLGTGKESDMGEGIPDFGDWKGE